jgi:predicted RNase H-like nuclease (RuvC/YqgF family)
MTSLRILALSLVVFIVAADSFAQTLADAARKERQRQQAARSKVVVTNSAKTGAAPAPTTAAPSSTPDQQAASKPATITDNKGRDEKYWRAAFQQARDDVKRAEARVEVLDLRLKNLNTLLLRQSDIYNREYRLAPEITAAQKELEDARKEVEQSKKKVTDLEDELRRSGGLPGWAR